MRYVMERVNTNNPHRDEGRMGVELRQRIDQAYDMTTFLRHRISIHQKNYLNRAAVQNK